MRVTRMEAGQRALFDHLDGIGGGEFDRRLIESAGIDVPGVVILRRVTEELQFVAAGSRRRAFRSRSFCRRGW